MAFESEAPPASTGSQVSQTSLGSLGTQRPSVSSMVLDEALADRLAVIALAHVTREYPNKLGQTLSRGAEIASPAMLHPIFFGSFDWHSCVHSYWMLAYLLRRFPQMAHAADIALLFNTAFVPRNVDGECAYFNRDSERGFERPYGWAWLLKLTAELHGFVDRPWYTHLTPLAHLIVRRFLDYLPLATYPVRVGTHFNTAFALALSHDYAVVAKHDDLAQRLRDKASQWYGADRDCPAWGEPGGDDFLSPTLIEVECMRRLLPSAEFGNWLDAFLPRLAQRQPAALFAVPEVSDRSDGKIAHLDGLTLTRAWCFRALSSALPPADPRAAVLREAAETHLDVGLAHVSGDYMGEHWLATYAVMALTA